MTMPWRCGLLLSLPLLCLALAAGCRQTASVPSSAEEPTEAPWFEDATAKLGLDFVHDPGPIDGSYFLPQIIGSGAALFDCDNDGRLELLRKKPFAAASPTTPWARPRATWGSLLATWTATA